MGGVTSSDAVKMNNVYAQHPEFKNYFDFILTANDYDKSKPDPECFLKGINLLGTTADNTFIFEDSLNGLKAARETGASIIGLTTTNSYEIIKGLCDYVIDNFEGLRYKFLSEVRKIKLHGFYKEYRYTTCSSSTTLLSGFFTTIRVGAIHAYLFLYYQVCIENIFMVKCLYCGICILKIN